MNDPFAVCGPQRKQSRLDHRARGTQVEWPCPLQQLCKTLTFQVLHHQEGFSSLRDSNIEHFDDVLVVDRRRGLRLARESADHFLLRRIFGMEELDGHLAAKRRMFGQKDRPHSALAQQSQDTITPVKETFRSSVLLRSLVRERVCTCSASHRVRFLRCMVLRPSAGLKKPIRQTLHLSLRSTVVEFGIARWVSVRDPTLLLTSVCALHPRALNLTQRSPAISGVALPATSS